MSSAASAIGMMQSMQQVAQSEAQTELIKAQAEKTRSETMPQEMNREQLERRLDLLMSQYNVNMSRFRTDVEYRRKLMQETAIGAVVERLRELQLRRETDTFSADVAARKARSQILNLEIPRMKSEAEFWDKAEDLPQWLKVLLQMMQAGGSARSILSR